MNKYIACGHSAIGKSHENEGIKCQDNCHFDIKDDIVVAAVADGVSSSKNSDIASYKAVRYVVSYCINKIRKSDSQDKIKKTIRDAFFGARYEIYKKAKNPNDYHTTLTVAVLINESLYFGQIGDSGIICLRSDGKFYRVTKEQNGEGTGKDRPVYPLAAVPKWTFGHADGVKAAFLATDGVLKKIQPSLLEKQKFHLNHSYLSYVFNNVYSNDDTSAKEWMRNEVEEMPSEEVDFDDKTLMFIINKKMPLKAQPKEYYNFPSNELWSSLIKEYEKELYPYRKTNKLPKESDKDQNSNTDILVKGKEQDSPAKSNNKLPQQSTDTNRETNKPSRESDKNQDKERKTSKKDIIAKGKEQNSPAKPNKLSQQSTDTKPLRNKPSTDFSTKLYVLLIILGIGAIVLMVL